MKKYALRLVVGLVVMCQFVFAANVPAVTSVSVDYVNNQLTINGSNFSPTGGTPTVTFAGGSEVALSFTNTQVVISIPPGLAAGTYDLVMANSVAQNQTTNFSVTVGASGPGSVSSLTFQQYCAIAPDGLESVWGLGANNLSRGASGCSKLVFMTSQVYTGDLGGYIGANDKCQTAAAAQGFPGKYKAWVDGNITSTAGTLTLISHSAVEYSLLLGSIYNGRIIAGSYADLTSGGLRAAIVQTELGTFVDDIVWTGLNADGTEAPGGYQIVACVDPVTLIPWTSSLASRTGGVGRSSYTDQNWSNSFYGPKTCNSSAHLYCFQQ